MEKLKIKLEVFEGPLDLLLFLIKENKMDIYDIEISIIVEQYIEYLNLMTQLNIDIATEFMVMASTLMYIKSKMLLPIERLEEGDIDVDDPRESLVQKLIEYKIFKEAASILEEKEIEMSETYRRNVKQEISAYTNREYLFDFSFLELLIAFKRVSDRMLDDKYHEITIEDFKIEDKIDALRNYFKYKKSVRFSEIVEKAVSKLEVVVYILAILELTRMKVLKIRQDEVFSEIWIYKNTNQ